MGRIHCMDEKQQNRAAGGGLLLAVVVCGFVWGCESQAARPRAPEVVGAFGSTGRGAGEFLYPRAIAAAADGTQFVVDKTGRVQRFDAAGKRLGAFRMPQIEAGKPVGLSVGPDGNLYVADTHYHRVMVFTPDGRPVRSFGRFGEADGCFIYPTDVAFDAAGRIFVGEYGGNDRINVFSREGVFLYSFGKPGDGSGEFARPAALCFDRSCGRLYVADACNHRIAMYTPRGELLGYIGSAGSGQGQLRYPYDLAMLADGRLVVCEYGNNRLQVFAADGAPRGTYGCAGRALGQLAYPWGVTVGQGRKAYVVDAGNNRVQIWQL